MKLKSLVKKFSYDDLVETCEQEGWKIPTKAEIENREVEYDTFWIADTNQEEDGETHAHIYQKSFGDGRQIANKNFLMNAVVIVEEKVCEWKYVEETFFDGYWHTECDNDFVVANGDTLKDNKFEFCPFCGNRIKETK